jgi:4-amino-4-deoxy-L-arabinose transferase-like glycosyltransferase
LKDQLQIGPYLLSTHQLLTGLIVLCCICYVPGMWIDVMEVDAAQYASMSMEMQHTGNFLQIYEQGRDYLDKPPLLFWMSSLGYWFFGFHTWVYKLPSVLFTLLAIYATYRYSLLHYEKTIALLAALILASSQAIFLMNNDVRTDNLLMGAVMLAFWQIGEIDKGHRYIKHFIGVGVGIGLAMLSKGPLGLVIPALGYGCIWLLQRNWRTIFQWGWIVSLTVIIVLLLPMCIGLYLQFDSQPDKVVFGRTGVSGLYFFFWEQSFGRITGASTWANDAGPFFFIHTYVYAFLPWVVFLPVWAVNFFRRHTQMEWISTAAFTATFIALSLSRFKLPHYIYITIPFAAIMMAPFLFKTLRSRWVGIFARFYWTVVLAFSGLILIWIFPVNWVVGILLGLILSILFIAISQLRYDITTYHLSLYIGAMLMLNSVLSGWFYPQLLQYQSSSTAMKWLQEQSVSNKQVYHYQSSKSALHFYNQSVVRDITSLPPDSQDTTWIFVRGAVQSDFEAQYPSAQQVQSFPDFPVTLLNIQFLNPKTREKVTGKSHLYLWQPQ